MQWGPQPGMGRPPALLSVVYVRVHHFRGRQFFTETSADVNDETIDLQNVVPIVPMEAQDEMGPAANSRGGGAGSLLQITAADEISLRGDAPQESGGHP